jgi:hypothetical protein
MDICLEKENNSQKICNTLQSKHVQFSMNNKNDIDQETQPSLSTSTKIDNEYEQIETLDNYLEMKSRKNPVLNKTPPILPPKPANLMKLQQISKQKKQFIDNHRRTIDSSESEQDNLYCSIGEVHETYKSIKIVAEIHETVFLKKHFDLIDAPPPTSNSVETFADIPKLPNVAEIISPKSTETFFQEKCTAKTPIKAIKPQSLVKNLVRIIIFQNFLLFFRNDL